MWCLSFQTHLMTHYLHYVRIAVTALSLTACVLLVALWVRSYYVADLITGHTSNAHKVVVTSFWGRLGLMVAPERARLAVDADIKLRRYEIGEWIAVPKKVGTLGFSAYSGEYGINVASPHWFLATLAGLFALVPWMRRFSLRTLLIATTLVAVGLGIVVAL
jgi:hypothetical protein